MTHMSRSLALLLAVFALLAPAYAGGAERVMERGDAACGCCCAPEAPAQLPSVDTPECGCSVPPSVPPAAPMEAPLGASASPVAELDLHAAPCTALLPRLCDDVSRAPRDRSPAPEVPARQRLGVWLL